MENTKGKKKHLVCEDIEDLVVGDVLVWDNCPASAGTGESVLSLR
jgi:hypothetical protein